MGAVETPSALSGCGCMSFSTLMDCHSFPAGKILLRFGSPFSPTIADDTSTITNSCKSRPGKFLIRAEGKAISPLNSVSMSSFAHKDPGLRTFYGCWGLYKVHKDSEVWSVQLTSRDGNLGLTRKCPPSSFLACGCSNCNRVLPWPALPPTQTYLHLVHPRPREE